MKKYLSALLAAAMMLSLLSGCGGKEEPAPAPADPAPEATQPVDENNPLYTKPEEEVSLEVWYAVSGITGETFAAQVEEYMAANPNVKIELSYAGSYSDAAEKISANLMTGTAPDVALIAAGPLYTGGRNDFSMATLIEDPEFAKDDIFEGVWDYAEFAGQICAVPYGISVPLLFYNKTILEAAGIDIEAEAPKTWDELYALAEKAQANGNVNNSPVFYGFEVSDAPWLFKSMLNQAGNTIIDTSSGSVEPAYNDAAALKVGQFWQKLVNGGLMPAGEHGNAEKTFLAGNCAFIVASSIRLARWSVDPVVDFGVLPMPAFDKESVALGGNVLITLPEGKSEAEQAAAWDLVKFLTAEEKHTEFALTTGYLPIYETAMDGEAVQAAIAEDPRRGVVYEQLNNAWSYWHFDEMGTMDWILGDMLGSIEAGTDVQEALDKGVSDLEREM